MNGSCSSCRGLFHCAAFEEEEEKEKEEVQTFFSQNGYTLALAGQPNVGKSTLFNSLTGVRQFVANYPGATVEKRSGITTVSGEAMTIVDLPGTYSLTSYSLEEKVAVDFLLTEEIDLIVQVVDASNLIRNLYLTFQLLELERPMMVALTMTDVARGRGMEVDIEKLSKELGIAVVATIANKGKGLSQLKLTILDHCKKHRRKANFSLDYGSLLETQIQRLMEQYGMMNLPASLPLRWLAIKTLEEDPQLDRFLLTSSGKRRGYA